MYDPIARIMKEQNIPFEKAVRVHHALQQFQKRLLCEKFKELDAIFETPKNSPLHHDNRCGVHKNV